MMTDVITKHERLTKADRCDRCGAQGYFQIFKGDLGLVLCGHHGRQHRDKLEELFFTVIDYTDELENDV